MSELLARVKTRLPEITDQSKDALLYELIVDAANIVKSYIGQKRIPEECESAVIRLAVIEYNRMGIEGESIHQEGGVSVHADALPEDIKASLRPFRIVRTCSNV